MDKWETEVRVVGPDGGDYQSLVTSVRKESGGSRSGGGGGFLESANKLRKLSQTLNPFSSRSLLLQSGHRCADQ